MKLIKKYFEMEEDRRKQFSYPYTKRQWRLRNLYHNALSYASLFLIPLVFHFLMDGVTLPTLFFKINIGIIVVLLLMSLVSYVALRKVRKAEKEYRKKHDFVPFDSK